MADIILINVMCTLAKGKGQVLRGNFRWVTLQMNEDFWYDLIVLDVSKSDAGSFQQLVSIF